MAVTPNPNDRDGVTLQAAITALQAKLLITKSAAALNAMNVQLDQYQRELVAHYLDVNRIRATTILSTLS